MAKLGFYDIRTFECLSRDFSNEYYTYKPLFGETDQPSEVPEKHQ